VFSNNDYGLEKLTRHQELQDYYERHLSCGKIPLIVDCGANSGMATRYFSETYPDAVVLGIEPDAENFALARANNEGKRATLLQAGIACEDAKAHLHDPGHGNWGYRVQVDEAGDLRLVSINTLLQSLDKEAHAPFILKIDIEGFESNLFEKNTEWIDSFPLIVIELHDWLLPKQQNSGNFLRQISSRNRDFVFHGENVFSISNTLL
jgi:FkbM family methyltransferase